MLVPTKYHWNILSRKNCWFVFSLDYHREISRRLDNCFSVARCNELILLVKWNNCRKGIVAFHKEVKSILTTALFNDNRVYNTLFYCRKNNLDTSQSKRERERERERVVTVPLVLTKIKWVCRYSFYLLCILWLMLLYCIPVLQKRQKQGELIWKHKKLSAHNTSLKSAVSTVHIVEKLDIQII